MELVNGYICHNCADVELAKKGIDPLNPKGASRGNAIDERPGGDDVRPRGPEELHQNQPLTVGPVGTTLNLLA